MGQIKNIKLHIVTDIKIKAQDENIDIATLVRRLSNKIDNVEERMEKIGSRIKNIGRREFFFSSKKLSWHQAQDECIKWGGHLVTVRSPYENNYFVDQMKKRKWREAWIGINDEKVEGEFVWVSGVQNFYTNWYAGEPNGGRNENCGEIVLRHGCWNDSVCRSHYNFIC